MKRFCSWMTVLCMLLTLFTAGASAETADGVYTGAAAGMMGDVTVAVTVANGVVNKVDVVSQNETPNIAGEALEKVPAAIVAANSYEVDGVAGATMTSNAIKAAVKKALLGEETKELSFEDDIDVIVVGAGLAGLTAGARAAELGANVLVIEKTGATGGSSNMAGGSLLGAGTHIQEAMGLEDDAEKMLADFVRVGGAGNFNEELARVYAEASGAAVNWVAEVIGVPMNPETSNGYYTPLNPVRGHYTLSGSGKDYGDHMRAFLDGYAEKGNAFLMFHTTMTDIIVEDRTVKGVKVIAADGSEKAYYAPSVILCTGGYGGNEALLKKWNFTNIASSSPDCVSGDGFTVLENHDVVFENMDICTAYNGCIPVNGFRRTLTYNVMNGSLWVGHNGSRLANEFNPNVAARSDVWHYAPNNEVYMVFNKELVPDGTKLFTDLSNNAMSYGDLDELMEKGVAFAGDTVEELAQKMGADPETLAATVQAFNAGCEAGVDANGRDQMLTKMENGPFYAVYTVPYVLITSGGPHVNRTLNPVCADGYALNGLYVAGELAGPANFSGKVTLGGSGHGSCIVLGRVAAELAVERAAQQ